MSAKILPFSQPRGREWQKVSHNLMLHIPTGYYYARKSKSGRGRLFKSTGLKKKGLAQTKADLMVSEWLTGGAKKKQRRVAELCDSLDDELQVMSELSDDAGSKRRRASTREKDKYMLAFVRKYFGEMDADAINEGFWESWCLRVGPKTGRKTLGDVAKYLSKVMTYAHREGVINRKPRLANPDARKPAPPAFTPDQVALFWKHSNQVMKDLILLSGECGLRPSEARELRKAWVSIPKSGRAVISIPGWFEKRGEGREIITSEGVTEMLERRTKGSWNKYVFPSPSNPDRPISRVRLSRYWKAMQKSVNIELIQAGKTPIQANTIRFHWLRHTFFTHALLIAQRPLAEVAAYGGNSPKVLFERYLNKDKSVTAPTADAVSYGLGKKGGVK
jgi:integrase